MKELEELDMEEEFIPRNIQYIVVHCSATCANIPFTEKQLLQCHCNVGSRKYGITFMSHGMGCYTIHTR